MPLNVILQYNEYVKIILLTTNVMNSRCSVNLNMYDNMFNNSIILP